MTTLASRRPSRITPASRGGASGRSSFGLACLVASEAIAGLVGFGVTIHLARTLGPRSFASLEFASALTAMMLLWVRSGAETIAIREIARNHRIARPITSALLGLKLLGAAIGLMMTLAAALMADRGRGVLAVSGLMLVPSALVADVTPRALGRLGLVAMAQVLRTLALASAGFLLVNDPDDLLVAASCPAIAEVVLAAFFATTRGAFAIPRRLPHVRSLVVLTRRGLVASVSRFARVACYGADVLLLGAMGTAGTGPYAAARRVVFAVVAVGIIVPGAVAPKIARAFLQGPEAAGEAIGRARRGLLGWAVPASLGLVLTAEGWMSFLFGLGYRGGGVCLALIAARTPFLLATTLDQAALVAVRLEGESMRIAVIQAGLAGLAVGLAATFAGPIGAAVAMIGVEAFGAFLGRARLAKLGMTTRIGPIDRETAFGCVVMAAVVLAMRPLPIWAASLGGASAFGLVRWPTMRRALG